MKRFFLEKSFLVMCLLGLFCSVEANAQPRKSACLSTPAGKIRNLVYETIWQQPAMADDFLIGSIIDVSYDHSGNICIVDYKQKNLVMLDSQGQWIRTLGREGEGPGEIRDARKVFFDGDRYGLLQAYPAAIVWLNSDGTLAEKTMIGNHDPENMKFISVGHAVQNGDHIYCWVTQMQYTESGEISSENNIINIGTDGNLGQILYVRPDEENANEGDGINEGKVYDIWMQRWTGAGKGGVWVAPERDQYILQHWNTQGELDLEVSRDYKPVVRNDEGVNSITVWFTRRGWTENQIRVGKTAPVVQSLHLGENGNLWVRLDQGGNNKGSDLLAVYDVISPAGQYLEQVRYHSSLEHNSWRMLDETTALFLVTNPDDDEVFLVLQKIKE